MVTIFTGRGTWLLASPSPHRGYCGTLQLSKVSWYTSQKGIHCLNFSEHHPSPSTHPPCHEILNTICFYSCSKVSLPCSLKCFLGRDHLGSISHEFHSLPLFLCTLPRSLYFPKCFIMLLLGTTVWCLSFQKQETQVSYRLKDTLMPTYCEKVILFKKDDGIYFIGRMRMMSLILYLILCKHLSPSGG